MFKKFWRTLEHAINAQNLTVILDSEEEYRNLCRAQKKCPCEDILNCIYVDRSDYFYNAICERRAEQMKQNCMNQKSCPCSKVIDCTFNNESDYFYNVMLKSITLPFDRASGTYYAQEIPFYEEG